MSKYHHFTLEERCSIARLREDGHSFRQIATALGRAPSSIAREVKRNKPSLAQPYKPAFADELAWARRWQGTKMERDPQLRHTVLDCLRAGWSPEQVSGRLGIIGKETIYRFIYKQIAKHKDYTWRHYLPRAKSKRGFRGRSGGSSVNTIHGRISIQQRPSTTHATGHHEADTLLFSAYGQAVLVTLEKASRYITLTKLKTRQADNVARHLKEKLKMFPPSLQKTLTVDNGTEFAGHAKIGVPTFFCDPHKPWQKGAIENANGRIRRWLPRKTDLSTKNQTDLDLIATIYNNTPRKCLGFKTPQEVLSQQLLHFKWDSTYPQKHQRAN